MKQRHLLGAVCFASAVLLSSSSWAAATATVDPSHGDVLINRGKGFTQIRRPVKVRVGSSVMVGPNSSAVIAYNDGCTVNVEPGTVKTVAVLSPCASGSSAQGGPSYTQQGNWCRENNDNNSSDNNNNYDPTCAFWPIWGGAVGLLVYEAISP
jgi:hypothetical protein